MYMEIFRGCYNCLRRLVTLIFVVLGWLLQEMSRPLSETATGARSAFELVSMAAPYDFAAFTVARLVSCSIRHCLAV